MTSSARGPAAPLRVFSDPGSVAVVGASADPAKWGHWLARGALAGRSRRRVHLVNGRAAEVLGEPCAPSLAALPEVPELVALCVPAPHVAAVVDEGLALGVRGFLGITAGVPEERALARRIRAGGARLVGANSLGIFDAATDLHLAWGHFTGGPLAIVSQSGQLGSEIAILAARAGIGVSRFVSVGNQADVTAAELLADLADHASTRAVALYLESFTDGRLLVDTLRGLRERGTPTVVLTVGGSDAARRAAQSHTGSLTSSLDVVDAACRAAGAIRVATPQELVDVVRMVLDTPLPAGPRVAVVADSGGQGGIAADVASAAGLQLPPLSATLAAELAGLLPPAAAVGNPIDLAGAGEADLATYGVIAERLLDSAEVDAVVLTGYFGCYAADVPSLAAREVEVAELLAKAAAASGRPLVVHSMSEGSPALSCLAARGVPTYPTIDTAAGALAAATVLAAQPGRVAEDPRPAGGGLAPGYWAARALAAGEGVRFPPGVPVRESGELAAAWARLRAPLVLKAGWLEHKSEAGGVRAGIGSLAELTTAFADMQGRLGAGEYVVEEQDTRADVVEMLVGARHDPDFGPVVVVGAGGTETELYRDVATELAPVDEATAAAMLQRLRCRPLLAGWRGRPPVDLAALVAVVCAVSRLAAHPDLAEIELNPVRIAPDGALAVDALVVPASPHPGDDAARATTAQSPAPSGGDRRNP